MLTAPDPAALPNPMPPLPMDIATERLLLAALIDERGWDQLPADFASDDLWFLPHRRVWEVASCDSACNKDFDFGVIGVPGAD